MASFGILALGELTKELGAARRLGFGHKSPGAAVRNTGSMAQLGWDGEKRGCSGETCIGDTPRSER